MIISYFKDALASEKCSTKYFNRAFLATFITEYNASQESGKASYAETQKTRFYMDNSGAYCVFLELWNEYQIAKAIVLGKL